MSFRATAIVALLSVFAIGSHTPVFAQPQVPLRPRYTAFQNTFRPGQPPMVNPGAGFLGAAGPAQFVNPNVPQAPGFVLPGQTPYGQFLPGAVVIDPTLAETRVFGGFNNLGNWYGSSLGSYGHWYPNGIANGMGVLGLGSGYGVGARLGVGPTSGAGGLTRPAGSALGTTLLGAATVHQLRR